MNNEMSVMHKDEFLNEEDDLMLNEFHTWASLTRAVLAILLRVGHVLIQVGSVPVNNVNLILLQNVVDVCWVTMVYVLIGFIIAYNGDVGGLIGRGSWIGQTEVDKNEAIIGWTAVVTASAICTSVIAGRTHTIGYLVIGFLLAGFIQPLLIHWAWTSNGWMRKNAINGTNDGFRDYAGSTVVHLTGGLSGAIGCLVFGRRVLKLKELDDASIAVGSSATVFAGELLVFVGLQSLSLPNCESEKSKILVVSLSHVYLNNLLAASSCCLFVVALHFVASNEAFNHWTVMRCVRAMVAGLVTVSAGTNDYSPQLSIALGCTGGTMFYLASRAVFHSALEDYCNILAVHLVCAILGSILAPVFSIKDNAGFISILSSFGWQLICLLAALVLISVLMTLTFLLLERYGLLRNRSEHLNHARAIAALQRGSSRSWLQRVFSLDNESIYLEPGSLSKSARREGI